MLNRMVCIQLTTHSWDWEISDVKWMRSDGREIQHQGKKKRTHCHLSAIGLINSYWRILRNNSKKKSELLGWGLVFQINFSNWSSNKTLICILSLSKSLMHWGIHLKLIWGYIHNTSSKHKLDNSFFSSNGWDMSFQETLHNGTDFHCHLWLWQENSLVWRAPKHHLNFHGIPPKCTQKINLLSGFICLGCFTEW